MFMHFLNYSFQDDRHVVDLATHSMTNNTELRSETLQPFFPNAAGPTSMRPLMPSQSMGFDSNNVL